MKAASSCSSCSSVTTSLGVVRSERERPEPSTIRGAIPSVPSSSVATSAPAAVLPAPPKRAPTTLISVSAMKLSDGWFICRSRSASAAERQAPTGTAASAVRPRRAPRSTSTPRWRSCLVKNVAAKLAGRFWKYGALRPVRPRLNVSAESGPPTSELSAKPDDGTPRRVSNADSSPITRPVIRRIPAWATCWARLLESTTSKSGSPPPRR